MARVSPFPGSACVPGGRLVVARIADEFTAAFHEDAGPDTGGSLRTKSGFGFPPVAGSSLILVVLMFFSGPAEAQTAEEERQAPARSGSRLMRIGYLNLNAVYPSPEEYAVRQRLSMPLYDETAAFDVRHVSSRRVPLDASAGLRVWSNLAVGVGVTYLRTRQGVDVRGTVPHPLFYDRPREVRQLPDGFRRTEVAAHLQGSWTIPLAGRLDLALSAGPSLLFVKHDSVSAIAVREVGAPYDQARTDVTRAAVRKRVPGANVGVDLTYHFIARRDPGTSFWTAGIGIFARWTTATAAPEPEFEPEQAVETGSLQAGAGLRFRF